MNTRHIWWTITPTLFEEILSDEIPICPVRQSIHIHIHLSIHLFMFLFVFMFMFVFVCAMGCESYGIVKGCCFISSESSFHNWMQTLWKQHVLANCDSEQSKNVIHIVITSLAKIYLSRQLEFTIGTPTNGFYLRSHKRNEDAEMIEFRVLSYMNCTNMNRNCSLSIRCIYFSLASLAVIRNFYIFLSVYGFYTIYTTKITWFFVVLFCFISLYPTHTHTRWIQLSLSSFCGCCQAQNYMNVLFVPRLLVN